MIFFRTQEIKLGAGFMKIPSLISSFSFVRILAMNSAVEKLLVLEESKTTRVYYGGGIKQQE